MREDTPIGIDIGSRSVKVTQAIKRGSNFVGFRKGIGLLPADFVWEAGSEPEPLRHALATALRIAGVKGKRAICVLPRNQVTLRFTELPAARPDEMEKMTALEAEQHIPLPSSETIVSYEIISETAAVGSLVPVLIAATRRTVVENYLALLSTFDLQVDQITVDSLCLFKLWQAQIAEPEPSFLLDIGANGMVMSLIESGLLRMSRTVPGGSDALTRSLQTALDISFSEAEELKQSLGAGIPAERGGKQIANWVEMVAAEIRRSTMAIATQYSQPTHLYLCGGGSLLKGLDACLEQAVGMKAVQLQPGQDGGSAQEGAVFALAFAASQAASQHPGALNLLPQETRERERLSQRRRLWRAALLAAVIALLTFIFGSAFTLQRREADLTRITPEWKEAVSDQSKQQEMAKKRTDLISQSDFLTAAHSGKHSFLNLLLDLHQQAPKGIWLTSLVLEKSPPDADKTINTLQITGKAPDNIVVADLVSKLLQMSGMKAVSLQSSKQTRFEDKQVVEFSLSCQFLVQKPEAALKKDELQAKEAKP